MTEPTVTTSAELKLRDDVQVDPTDWAARAAAVRTALAAEELPSSAMLDALSAFRFLDDSGRTWTYNGTDWLCWNGTAWLTSAPPAALKLQPFTLDAVPDAPDQPPAILSTETSEPLSQPSDVDVAPQPEPAALESAPMAELAPMTERAPMPEPAPEPTPEPVAAAPAPEPVAAAPEPAPVPERAPAPEPVAAAPVPAPAPELVTEPVAAAQAPSPPSALASQPAPSQPMPQPMPQTPVGPTHITPPTGLSAWAEPNPASPQVFLAPGLPLAVVEWTPSGWARVVASNGWTGWVDGRLLVPVNR